MKNKKQKQETPIDFEAITIRMEASRRGGGVEIDLTTLGYEDERMIAYQNYLGGGMLGSIGNDCTIRAWKEDKKLVVIADRLARYFHSITNEEAGAYDEWAEMSFEKTQGMPRSAY